MGRSGSSENIYLQNPSQPLRQNIISGAMLQSQS
jgi:hypothetical protein